MIMGASHITLGCRDVDVAAVGMREYGYFTEFVDRRVINNLSKQSILASRCDLHDIALLRSDGGFPIELISYQNEIPDVFGRYIGVFGSAGQIRSDDNNSDLISIVSGLSARSVSESHPGKIADLDVPALFFQEAETKMGLAQIVLPVSDMNRAKRLWCGALGFSVEQQGAETAVLKFVSPIAAWRLRMLLVGSPLPATRPVLDAKGMACLSLLSSNVAEDVARAIAGGARLETEIFAISINGRNMKVAILTDPDGAFVELLQIVR
jgi:catechol 2,3-dioxygenase-like lactoylglutathione lyase family enzyme